MQKQRMFSQTIDEAIATLERLFKNFEAGAIEDENRFVSILISRPGLGKSATISKMAQRIGYTLIDLNLACIEPTDIIGLGAREKIDGKWQTMPALPQWAEKALAGKCIIFVDEFNNTTQDVLSGFQKMFSDFVIDGQKLPKTTHIIGACNPPGRDAIYAAKKLSGAFRRRLCMLPVTDDFQYVMKKHNFIIPRGFVEHDYEDLMNYCEYDEISSAVIDNIFNIVKYPDLSDYEKITLINGFGSKAFDFARELQLFSPEVFAAGRRGDNSKIDYQEWKKNPKDVVSEYQQILWAQEVVHNSVSYRNCKRFLAKIENGNVYTAVYDLIQNKFYTEYELDEMKLPETNASQEGLLPSAPAVVGGGL